MRVPSRCSFPKRVEGRVGTQKHLRNFGQRRTQIHDLRSNLERWRPYCSGLPFRPSECSAWGRAGSRWSRCRPCSICERCCRLTWGKNKAFGLLKWLPYGAEGQRVACAPDESTYPEARRSVVGFHAQINTSDSWPLRMVALFTGISTPLSISIGSAVLAEENRKKV